MLRTKLSLSRLLPGLAACCALVVSSTTQAAPPPVPGAPEPDYEASGFIVPAGYQAPSPYPPGGVMQTGAPYGQVPMYQASPYGVAPAGYNGAGYDGPGYRDAGYGDAGYGDPGCGPNGCGTAGCGHCGGLLGGGGLLGRLGGCGGCGACDECASGLSGWRHMCLFCQGQGCGLCQSIGQGHLLGALSALRPYTEAGIGAQRWYDLSVEALFLSLDTDGPNQALTSNGIAGPIVLRSADAMDDSLHSGVRLSAAMICGAGGNVELTYMGVNDLGDSARVLSNAPDLYSFLSDFGTVPFNGFDDTDRSLFQGVRSESRFNSGEFNYRRRWVGPYSRFQGSWLAGIRYVDFDDMLQYTTAGQTNNGAAADGPRFFDGRFKAANSLTGMQLGGDLWWNVYPGINLGVGLKGAALGNDSRIDSNIRANSVATSTTLTRKDSDDAWLTEFDATLIYRFAYSWSFRSSYYLIDINDVALGATGLQNFSVAGGPGIPVMAPLRADNDIRLQGFSVGLEYLW